MSRSYTAVRSAVAAGPALRGTFAWVVAFDLVLLRGYGNAAKEVAETVLGRLEQIGSTMVAMAIVSAASWVILGIVGEVMWKAAARPVRSATSKLTLQNTRPGVWAPLSMRGRTRRIPSMRTSPVGAFDPKGSTFRVLLAERIAERSHSVVHDSLARQAALLGLKEEDIEHLSQWVELPCSAEEVLRDAPRDIRPYETLLTYSGDWGLTHLGVVSDETWEKIIKPTLGLEPWQVREMGRAIGSCSSERYPTSGVQRSSWRTEMIEQIQPLSQAIGGMGMEQVAALVHIVRETRLCISRLGEVAAAMGELPEHRKLVLLRLAPGWQGDADMLIEAVKAV